MYIVALRSPCMNAFSTSNKKMDQDLAATSTKIVWTIVIFQHERMPKTVASVKDKGLDSLGNYPKEPATLHSHYRSSTNVVLLHIRAKNTNQM